jgi:hypothetical protein
LAISAIRPGRNGLFEDARMSLLMPGKWRRRGRKGQYQLAFFSMLCRYGAAQGRPGLE